MSIKRKKFIVLALGDTESWGFNEETLPLLLQLVDSSCPDHRQFTHARVIAYYFSSPQTLRSVEGVVSQAEMLRDSDSRFVSLGIGLAEGEMLAEYDLMGRLKTERLQPIGGFVADASRVEREGRRYKEALQTLRERLHDCAA